MEHTNEHPAEGTTEDVESSAPETAVSKTPRSNRRSRYSQKSATSTEAAANEMIGEIQLAPGEILKDDLTANSNAARKKSTDREGDSGGDRRPHQESGRGGRRDARPRHEKRSDRGRQNRDEGEKGPTERRERRDPSDKQDREKKERSSRGHRERSHQDNRESGRSSRRRRRSGRRDSASNENSSDIKPATWNAVESGKGEGLLSKVGRLLSSIFGGSKQQSRSKKTDSPRTKTAHRKGKRPRRRSRSRSGNRGRQRRN